MIFTDFIQPKDYARPRDDRHKAKFPDYPHPTLILSKTQQYFFRNSSLKHLRIEQVVRYFSTAAWIRRGEHTVEDTIEENQEEHAKRETNHRHYDSFAEKLTAGQKFPSRAVDCDIYQRRRQARLGVTRAPTLEPLGYVTFDGDLNCHIKALHTYNSPTYFNIYQQVTYTLHSTYIHVKYKLCIRVPFLHLRLMLKPNTKQDILKTISKVFITMHLVLVTNGRIIGNNEFYLDFLGIVKKNRN